MAQLQGAGGTLGQAVAENLQRQSTGSIAHTRLDPVPEEITFSETSRLSASARLRVSLATVKIRLHRARARLHEELRLNCRCYYAERGEHMCEPKKA